MLPRPRPAAVWGVVAGMAAGAVGTLTAAVIGTAPVALPHTAPAPRRSLSRGSPSTAA